MNEEEREEMISMLNKCRIRISNYVYTLKIIIDREASENDPRICKEERSTYIPEPLATYVASLEHVQKPDSAFNPYQPCSYDGEVQGQSEHDPYIFAMLSGLRSMSEETEEYVNRATNMDRRPDGELPREKRIARDAYGNIIHVWTSDPVLDQASKEAIAKGAEIHGPRPYSASPFDRFDLIDLVRKFAPYAAKCNLPRFAAAILRTYCPSASCSLFAPKKIVNTGARTNGVGQYAVMKTVLFLREKGYKRACPLGDSFTAQNVVATFIFPFLLDLEKLCEQHADIVSYNPETFPGVRVRAPQIAPAAQLAFASGRVVTMGGRSPMDHVRALSATFPMYYSVRAEEKNTSEDENENEASCTRESSKGKRALSETARGRDKQVPKRRKKKISGKAPRS